MLKPLLTREDWRSARESVLLGPPVSPRCVVQWFGVPGCNCDDPYHSHGRHHCRCGNEWFDGEDAEMVMHRLNPHNDQDKDYINRLMYTNPCRVWFPEGGATGYVEDSVKSNPRDAARCAA